MICSLSFFGSSQSNSQDTLSLKFAIDLISSSMGGMIMILRFDATPHAHQMSSKYVIRTYVARRTVQRTIHTTMLLEILD
jgi:hypothetical protein